MRVDAGAVKTLNLSSGLHLKKGYQLFYHKFTKFRNIRVIGSMIKFKPKSYHKSF